MEKIRITLDENTQLDFDSIDIGTADDVISFEISGRIVGLDETTLGEIAGSKWVPAEIVLEPRMDASRDEWPKARIEILQNIYCSMLRMNMNNVGKQCVTGSNSISK